MVEESQLAKLPRWAKSHILGLETRVRDLERIQAEEHTPLYDGDEARVFLIHFIGGKSVLKPIGGCYTNVLFLGEGRSAVEVSATLTGSQKVIRVAADQLTVRPEAANVVFVDGTNHWGPR